MDSGTALGLGMVSGLFGVRWAVERWEKAKKRWWSDYNRVGEGLKRDLEVWSFSHSFFFCLPAFSFQTTLDQILRDKVVVVAQHAADSIQDMVDKRKQDVNLIKEALEDLEEDIHNIENQTKSSK